MAGRTGPRAGPARAAGSLLPFPSPEAQQPRDRELRTRHAKALSPVSARTASRGTGPRVWSRRTHLHLRRALPFGRHNAPPPPRVDLSRNGPPRLRYNTLSLPPLLPRRARRARYLLMSEKRFPDVPGGYPFPQLELRVLDRWRERGIFEKSLRKPAPQGEFVFFEGPPTANNVPHVGHVVTRVVKDLFPRYRTMRGYHVARKAGWDTHGLAVEIEVEKKLGFSGKQQIEAYGIAEFNQACLDSVHTYERQWRAMSERVGYWLDLDHAYLTYTNTYIESVWWSLSELAARGLLNEGYKIQPYCARCGTTLSSHEVAQNYKDADDPSVWVLFPARPGQSLLPIGGGEWTTSPGLQLVAWTTTPWTLLAHVGLTVNPDMVYRIVPHPDPDRADEQFLIGDELERAVPLASDFDGERKVYDLREQPTLAKFRGKDLEGL